LKNCGTMYIFNISARVAELADAPDLGSGARKGVGVRVPPFAPFNYGVSLEVQVQKEQTSPVECELKVAVASSIMTDKIASALDDLTTKIRLPGFRPGHIPRRVLVDRFGSTVTQEAIQDVLQEAYREALTESNVIPVAPGEMSDVQYKDGDPLTFTVKVEVAPEFDLPPLSEITVELPQPSVEDADVLGSIDGLRESHALLTPDEDPITADCVINVDLQELDQSGLPIVGRVQKDLQVDLSHSHLGEDFAAKVIGLTLGGTAVMEFPMRSTENEPKTSRFQVTIQNIRRKELPPLDDEFARSVNPRLETLDALKNDIRRYLEARAAHEARERMFRSVVEALLRKVDFPVPPRMLEDYLDRMVEEATHGRKRKPDIKEVEQFKEEYRASAVWNLRWYLARKKFVADRAIEVTEDDFKAEVERLAAADGANVSEFKKRLNEHQEDHIREDLLERKVLAMIESEVQTIPRPMSLAEFEGRTPGRVVSV
jgi:trigger factor